MIVIIDVKRTPFGKFRGSLSNISAPELAAHCIEALLKYNDLDPSQLSEVILGNTFQAGNGQNPARVASIQAHIPTNIPAFTINKVCGSGLKAITLADQAIQTDNAKLILAGGFESMSQTPHLIKLRDEVSPGNISLSNIKKNNRKLIDSMIHDGLWDTLYKEHVGSLMDHTIKKFKILREEQDSYALRSHQLAVNSNTNNEIIPIKLGKRTLNKDEGPRSNTDLARLSILPSAFPGCTTVTAGNACQLSDGAAIALLANEKTADNLSLKPMAKITGYISVATDPKWFGIAPVLALRKLEEKTHKKTKDYDLIELNESFAAQVLAVIKDANLDENKINISGGAIAIGHPIAASGTRLISSLINNLKQNNLKSGIATTAIGGGQAMAMSLEIL